MLTYLIAMLVCTMQGMIVRARALYVTMDNMAVMWMWLMEWFVAELHDVAYTGIMGLVIAAAAALCFMGFSPSKEVHVHRIIRHYSMGWAYLVSFDRAAADFRWLALTTHVSTAAGEHAEWD
jgi:hypothetical protein